MHNSKIINFKEYFLKSSTCRVKIFLREYVRCVVLDFSNQMPIHAAIKNYFILPLFIVCDAVLSKFDC